MCKGENYLIQLHDIDKVYWTLVTYITMLNIKFIPRVNAYAVRWPGISKDACSRLGRCSKAPIYTLQYVELRGYFQGVLQLQTWVSANGVLKDCMKKVYLVYRILMKY